MVRRRNKTRNAVEATETKFDRLVTKIYFGIMFSFPIIFLILIVIATI